MKKLYFNKALAIKKNIYDKENPLLYIKMTNLYKKIFEKYLDSVIDIKKYDNDIMNSNLGIGSSELEFYRPNKLGEYLNLNFIYNLNCFFVENLSIENINILKDAIEKESYSYKSLSKMVESTYKEVIKDSRFSKNNEGVFFVNYSDYDEIEYFRNGAIAFKICYKLTTETHSKEEFFAMDKKRDNFLEKIKSTIINEVESKLKVKCDVLVELCGK